MGMKSRTKGKGGEREISALLRDLTGHEVRRRVRQREGDSDLEGIPGWCIEVKRHAKATRADVSRWWSQAAAQAARDGGQPVLFYRQDRDEWRAVWRLAVTLRGPFYWDAYAWTCEGTPDAWATVFRETMEVSRND